MADTSQGAGGAPRVTLVAHRFSQADTTGIGRYYVETAKALAALRPRTVHYEIASPAEPAGPAWLPPNLAHRRLRGQRQALLMSWCLAAWPPIDARAGSPDVVHVLHPWVPVPARAPLVATVHDLMPILHPEWYGRRERWAYQRGAAHLRDHAARVVAISGFVADQVHDHLRIERDRIAVVHNGIDDRFHLAPPADSPAVRAVAERYGVEPGRYLVVLGAVSVRKNLTPLFDALAAMPPLATAPNHDLLVVGPPGQGAATVQAAAEQRGLGARVHFAGFAPDADLPALLAGSLALVHPSLDEGFGLTPLEAMAAGTVAIASTAGSLPEVVGSAGILVDPTDGDAWAEAVTTLRADPARRAALVAQGRPHAARFSWAAAAERLRELHLAILAAGPAAPGHRAGAPA